MLTVLPHTEERFDSFVDPRSTSPNTFMQAAPAYGVSKYNARQLMGRVLGVGDLDPLSWSAAGIITKKLAATLAPLPSLTIYEILTSAKDNFQKIIFKTHDGMSVETVIIPLLKENKVSICLSSQVGCVMGCTFCATARMKDRRNLESWEIFDQLSQARKIAAQSGRQVSGAVFMGMGEPFLNYKNVLTTAELLCFPVLNAISSKAITISTVGLVSEIDRFTTERRPFRLSISLGAATDEKRKKLVPIAARTPVESVIAAARRYGSSRRSRVNLAYVCIQGENVFEEDARELGRIIGDLPVRLDLIEVNDTSGRYLPPSEIELKAFRGQLDRYLKQPVVRRYSGGSDIRAACGTLAGV